MWNCSVYLFTGHLSSISGFSHCIGREEERVRATVGIMYFKWLEYQSVWVPLPIMGCQPDRGKCSFSYCNSSSIEPKLLYQFDDLDMDSEWWRAKLQLVLYLCSTKRTVVWKAHLVFPESQCILDFGSSYLARSPKIHLMFTSQFVQQDYQPKLPAYSRNKVQLFLFYFPWGSHSQINWHFSFHYIHS